MGLSREERLSAVAQRIAEESGLASRVVLLLLERAAREGFELAIDEIAS